MATGEVHPAAILIHEHTIFDSHAIIRFAVFPILVDQRGATVPHKSIRDVLVPDQVDPSHLSLDKRLDKAVLLGAEDCYQSCALFWTRSIGAVSFRWVWEILIAGIAPLHPTVSARDRGWQGTDGPSCELRTRSRGSGISLSFFLVCSRWRTGSSQIHINFWVYFLPKIKLWLKVGSKLCLPPL